MSQVKYGTIQDVLTGNVWDGPYGRVFYYKLVMDNGEMGEIGTKTQDGYKIGDSLHYTSETGDNGTKFKRASQEQIAAFQGNGGGQPQGGQPARSAPAPLQQSGPGGNRDASFCLSYAKDIVVAAVPRMPDTNMTVNQLGDLTLALASRFSEWMKENA